MRSAFILAFFIAFIGNAIHLEAIFGSASGAFDSSLQAAIIIKVILTTFLAPPLLKLAFKSNPIPTLKT